MTKKALKSIITKEDYEKMANYLEKKADEYASTGGESSVHDEEYNIDKGLFEVCINFEIKVEREDIYENGEDIRVKVTCDCNYADYDVTTEEAPSLEEAGFYMPDEKEVKDHTDFDYAFFE